MISLVYFVALSRILFIFRKGAKSSQLKELDVAKQFCGLKTTPEI